MFTRRQLLSKIDSNRIRAAIEAAEERTSGEIRVSIAPLFWGSVEKAARSAFARLGMTNTKDRNGVLFFVVPSRRRFVVLGDQGIHDRVGQEFWEGVARAISGEFRDGHFTEGLVSGITEVGKRLAEHFPYDPTTDVDELPDDVDFQK